MARKPKKIGTNFDPRLDLAPDVALAPVDYAKEQIKQDTGFYVTQYHQTRHRTEYFSIKMEEI